MRYFLEIAYKGTSFHGWQLQNNAHSVQQEINSALKKLFGKKIETLASGRTDTGVHAEQQFVQIDSDTIFNEQHLFKLNQMVSRDIVIKNFHRVKDNVSARFDAKSRTYEYRVSTIKNPFLKELTYYLRKELNLEEMNKAAEILFKYNDFESFSKVHTDVDHFFCDMFKARWTKKKDILIFEIEANRFLRGMVRTIVGTILEVGFGRMSVQDFEKIIKGKDRKLAGRAVPPEGLFLTKIKYPANIFLK